MSNLKLRHCTVRRTVASTSLIQERNAHSPRHGTWHRETTWGAREEEQRQARSAWWVCITSNPPRPLPPHGPAPLATQSLSQATHVPTSGPGTCCPCAQETLPLPPPKLSLHPEKPQLKHALHQRSFHFPPLRTRPGQAPSHTLSSLYFLVSRTTTD